MAPTSADEPFDINDDSSKLVDDGGPELTPLPKTRSCEDLSTALDHGGEGQTITRVRRLSDPHIATDPKSLIQSTDSLISNMERKERCDALHNGDFETAACVSSETLTEANGMACEASQQVAVVQSTDPAIEGKQQNGHVTDAIRSKRCADTEDCETSQYGIATIESPHSASAQDVREKSPSDNGLHNEVIGSTDTLTGETTDGFSEEQTGDSGTVVVKTACQQSSQKSSTVMPEVKSGFVIKNGHRMVTRVENDVTGKLPSGQHGDNQRGNVCQKAGETASPFCLEDVLSKLNIESILDATSLRKDGIELNVSLPSISRGSSSGREDTGDGSTSSYQSRTPNSSTGPPTPGTDLKVKTLCFFGGVAIFLLVIEFYIIQWLNSFFYYSDS